MNRFGQILLSTTALVLAVEAQSASAEEAAATAAQAGGEGIIVTGTRQSGVRAADSPAPIQLIGAQAFQNVGQQDLTQVLAQSVPSLNFSAFGGDTSNLTLTAALRGINPNDTLVLVNGKRRHFTSNLAVLGGSPYSGAATTDLSFIPTAAIGHIEVLQDGAAAQYGSDAIAGVVNIILKDANHGGAFTAGGGQYYKGDGKTAATALNLGFGLGDKGFFNVTGEYRFHDYSQRGTYDVRYFNADGSVKSNLSPLVANGLASAPGTPYVNQIIGDARYAIYNLAFNAGYQLSPDVSAYAFGSYGNRTARSHENYRAANKVSGTSSAGVNYYPLTSGFTPLEAIREEDFSLTAGLKGELAQWAWDASLTYGRDSGALSTLDSANLLLFSAEAAGTGTQLYPQRNFYDGTLTNSEWTLDLGATHDFEVGLAKPLNLALGGQCRRDSYGIAAGEYGSYALGGASSYPGFAPTDAGVNSRTAFAGYVDLAVDLVTALHVDLAGRYEHYSEFGSVADGKATARYDFTPAFALRGTVANGFRAPTLAEEYYSSVNVSPSSTFGQLPPNSAAAQLLGFGKLQPEKSTNLSLGFVAHPAPKLQLTLDAYQISIKNRIVASGSIYGWTGSAVASQAVLDALAGRGIDTSAATLATQTSGVGVNVFTNGADTRTRGIEATANYASELAELGKIDWSLGVNYNDTVLTRVASLPAAVYNAAYGQTTLLTQQAIDGLTVATPRVKVIANALWSVGALSINLRETVYGSVRYDLAQSATVTTPIQIGTTAITDLDVGYKLTQRVRFDLGANNLFDKQAPTVPTVNGAPADGNVVLNRPISYTPWGINGGYYYARLTVAL